MQRLKYSSNSVVEVVVHGVHSGVTAASWLCSGQSTLDFSPQVPQGNHAVDKSCICVQQNTNDIPK